MMTAHTKASSGPNSGGLAFYTDLPALRAFAEVGDPTRFTPLPDDWWIGLSDVVSSTDAIAAGRYKAVNMAGASVISAVGNAIGSMDFPFVFAGDGASFAVPPALEGAARRALAGTIAWVSGALDLTMRGAMVDVAMLRAQGRDVRVGRVATSPDVTYAMFSGGGLALAERAMKEGRYVVEPEPGARPDLTGLSCRFEERPAVRGVILSLIVAPVEGEDTSGFQACVADLVGMIDDSPEASHPLSDASPPTRWPSSGTEAEARLHRREGESLLRSRARTYLTTFLALLVFKLDLKIGGFVPKGYMRELVANSDFRKFGDSLMLTLDCSVALADRLEARAEEAARAGVAQVGVHRQKSALLTCIVPSALRADHVHFVDGAAGGYTLAARELKARSGLAASDNL